VLQIEAMVSADVVVLIASAGGLAAITQILESVPPGLPASVIVLQHVTSKSMLVDILARRSALPVVGVTEGTTLEPGRVYVIPGQREVLLDHEGFVLAAPMRTSQNPGDALLESVAETMGARALVCVLTGTGNDGAHGAALVRMAGGTVLAQDPQTAEYPEMPHAAIHQGAVDLVLPLHALGTAIVRSVAGKLREDEPPQSALGRRVADHVRLARAPLATLASNALGPLAPPQQEALAIIQDSLDKLAITASQLTWIERLQSGVVRSDVVSVDATALTMAVAERYRADVERTMRTLVLDCAPSGMVKLDPTAWEWTVGSLLEHAIASAEGAIELVQRSHPKHLELVVTMAPRRHELRFLDEVLAVQHGLMQIEDTRVRVWVPAS
jgi:two-component system chemotaxis response regulator CheB